MEKIFTHSTILEERKNTLHMFEILLATLFTNVKGERDLNMIKTDSQNRMGENDQITS